MVSSGEVPSDFNWRVFSSGPIFEFFNTIRRFRPFSPLSPPALGAEKDTVPPGRAGQIVDVEFRPLKRLA
jgi:hypothetical protein